MSDVVRLRSGEKFTLYKIEEAVYQGKTDVMSCTVVHTGENDGGCVVVHVDPQPISTVPKEGF